MTSTTTDEPVLKSDTKGRVRLPAEQRESLLNEFATSGLSAMKFAALAGVKYPTFANWVQRRRKSQAELAAKGAMPEAPAERPPARPVQWFEAFAEMSRAGHADVLRVELPGGATLSIASPSQLRLAAELLQLLHPKGGRRTAC